MVVGKDEVMVAVMAEGCKLWAVRDTECSPQLGFPPPCALPILEPRAEHWVVQKAVEDFEQAVAATREVIRLVLAVAVMVLVAVVVLV